MDQRYKDIINSMNDAVFVCYINFGKTLGNFVEVNDSACSRLGYTREELLQLNPLQVIFGNSDGIISEIVDRLFEDGHLIFDVIHRTKYAQALPAEISSHIFNYNGRPALLAISRDISARQKVEDKLKMRTQRMRSLALRLQSIREEERSAIAREIHDQLGQSLTALKIQVSLLANKLNKNQGDLKNRASVIISLIDSTVDSVQRITMKLRPGILDELGLLPAIEWQANDFQKNTGISCMVELSRDEIFLDKDKATAVFRIFQEALTNIARHANAAKVKITLLERFGIMILTIVDNGKGITASQINDPRSLGLLGMKERALVFGGSVDIKSSMNNGTTVTVEIPITSMQDLQ